MSLDSQILDVLRDVRSPFTYVALAVFVGGVVRALKTQTAARVLENLGKIFPFVRAMPPKAARWVAVALAFVVVLLDARLNAGLPWQSALVYAVVGAVLSGGGAIGGHETVAKTIASLLSPPGASGGPSGTNPSEKGPPGTLRIALVAGAIFGLLSLAPPAEPTLPTPAPLLGGCHLLNAKNAKAVLSVADILCLETGDGAAITETKAAMAACRLIDVAPEVVDVIEKLIGQREAGKRAGFMWHPEGVVETVAKDAGP